MELNKSEYEKLLERKQNLTKEISDAIRSFHADVGLPISDIEICINHHDFPFRPAKTFDFYVKVTFEI